MRLTYKFNFTDKTGYLENYCRISKNLYNQANYIIKQELNTNHKWIRNNQLDKIMKETKNLEGQINYKLLKIQTSQQILKQLDKNWSSFFKSIKDWKIHKEKYKKMPRPPKYIKDLYLLIYTNQNSRIKENKLYLDKKFYIQIPEYKGKDFSKYQQVRIIPKRNNLYEIEIIYNQDIKNVELDSNKYASIDLGVNNLITLVSENQPIIFNGKILKSYNQFYNKQKAKLCSIKDKMGIKRYTNLLNRLEQNRKQFIRDYLHKVSRLIVNYLIKNRIETIVVGLNRLWKTQSSLSKRNNQAFVSIPHSKLISYLEYKCKLVGIKLIKTEEGYTSKCDSLALEPVEKQECYLGKRIKRGLFQSKIGKLINADVNGALNILRKVIGDCQFVIDIINSGLLFRPVKIRSVFDSTSLQTFLLKGANNV
jgi:IS605 OrfB family transposase